MTEWDQTKPRSVCFVLWAADVLPTTWRCTQNCFGLDTQVMVTSGMQSNELHHRLKRDVQPGLHRVFEPFLKAVLLRPFPQRLTKLVPLEAACTCIVISPPDGISTLLSLLVFCLWNAHHGHSGRGDDCCNTNLWGFPLRSQLCDFE